MYIYVLYSHNQSGPNPKIKLDSYTVRPSLHRRHTILNLVVVIVVRGNKVVVVIVVTFGVVRSG